MADEGNVARYATERRQGERFGDWMQRIGPRSLKAVAPSTTPARPSVQGRVRRMPRDLPVHEIMTTAVITLHAEDSVEDAVRTLAERGISGAPVVDDDGRLVGLLDDSDLILSEAKVHAPSAIEILGAYIPVPGTFKRFEDEVRHALARTVADLTDPKAPSVGPEATLEDVATAMVGHRVSRVPVVDENRRVIGIVSRGDLVHAMGRQD